MDQRPWDQPPLPFWPLAAWALLLALASQAIDSQPRFHLGDSWTYLTTAWRGPYYADRPWAYGVFSVLATAASRDIAFVARAQILAVAAVAVILALALHRAAGLRGWGAAALIAVLVFEPLSAWWARSFMPDSLAMAAMVVLLAAALWPGVPVWLRVAAVAAATPLLAFLRNVHAVPLLAVAVAYPATCWILARWVQGLRAGRADAAAVGLGLLLGVGGFAVLNSVALGADRVRLHHEPARFALGAVAPLLKGREAMIPLSPERLARLETLDRSRRIGHSFSPHGLYGLIMEEHGPQGERIGADLATRAMLADPLGMAALTLTNWSEYLNPGHVLAYHAAAYWSGAVPYHQPAALTPEQADRLRALGIWQGVREDWPALRSPALRWFRLGGGVSALILAWAATRSLPLVLLTGLRRLPQAWLMALLATAIMGFSAVTVNAHVSRYLIAALPPLLALAALALGLARGRLAPAPVTRP